MSAATSSSVTANMTTSRVDAAGGATASLRAASWLAWEAAVIVAVSVSDHPLVSVLVIASCGLIVSLMRRPDAGSAFRLLVTLGLVFAVARIVLFSATGRAGSTTLFVSPSLRLPVWLGGIEIGGPISGEVVAVEIVESLRILAVLVAAGTVYAVTDLTRLVRLVPRRWRHLGLVLQVAIAFVPSLAASVREVTDAQRARGHRFGPSRSFVPLIVPVLAGALDRAFTLAQSLHTRGFERAHPTRMRPEPKTRPDRIVVTGAWAMLAGTILAAIAGGASWSPYPVLSWPTLDAWTVIVPAITLLPLVAIAFSSPRATLMSEAV